MFDVVFLVIRNSPGSGNEMGVGYGADCGLGVMARNRDSKLFSDM